MSNLIHLDKPEILAYLRWYKTTTEGLFEFCSRFNYNFSDQLWPLQDHLGSYIEALDNPDLFHKCWVEVFDIEFE